MNLFLFKTFQYFKNKGHQYLMVLGFLICIFFEFQSGAQYNLGAFWKGVLTQIYTVDSKIVESSMYSADRRENDNFGQSLSVSGDTMVVGAAGHDYDLSGGSSVSSAGAAFVFTRSGTTWALQQKLIATGTNARNPADQFGLNVSVHGDTIVVGSSNAYDAAGGNSLSGAGAAWVFTRSGDAWTLQQKIVHAGRQVNDVFGSAVAIWNDTIVVGANAHDYNSAGGSSLDSAGAVYVYTRSGTTWSQQQKITPTGTNARMVADRFGSSVAIFEDTIAVGANFHDYNATGASSINDAGAVFIYTRSGTTWSQQQKLVGTGTNGRHDSSYFSLVSISGDTLAVGAYSQDYDEAGGTSLNAAGAVFVFTRSGTTWSIQQKLVGTGTNGRKALDSFGRVSVSGDTIVVGAIQQDYDEAGGTSLNAAGAVFVFTRSGTTWSIQQKLVGTGTNGRMGSDEFGLGIALSGDTIVAGARKQSYDAAGGTSLEEAGAAYVFTRSSETWSDQQKIVPIGSSFYSGRTSQDLFGHATSIDGDTLVIGAMYQSFDTNGGNSLTQSGAVYVFTRSGTTWSQQQKLVSSDRRASDRFGLSVAISGETIVVGANQQDYDASGGSSIADAGAAYVFTRSGTVWSQQQKLVATGTNARVAADHFGGSVAISGHTIAVGVADQDYNATGAGSLTDAGAVYVFTRDGVTWTQQQKLVGTGTNGRMAGDSFGVDVFISGETLVVGADLQDYNATGGSSMDDAGAVYVFTRSGTTWTQQQKLVATGVNSRMANFSFGERVSISGDTVVVGDQGNHYDDTGSNSVTAAGAVFVFTRNGTVWTQQQRLIAKGHNGRNSADYFSYSVSISGDTIAVGARGHDYDVMGNNSSSDTGAVYVYTRSGTNWSFVQKITGVGVNGRIWQDYFGASVSVSGDTILIGAYAQDFDVDGNDNRTQAGAAWIFSVKP